MMAFFADPEVWVGVAFALVLALFVYMGVFRMLGASLDKRAATISTELDEAKRLRDEAAALLEQYKKKAVEAEKEAAVILTDAKAEAERFATEARAQLKNQIARRAEQAQQKIAQAEQQALAEIRALAADAAAAAAEKLIAARLDEKKAGAIVQQSLSELPGKLN